MPKLRGVCHLGSKQQECGQLWWKVEKYLAGQTTGWIGRTSCADQIAFSQTEKVSCCLGSRCLSCYNVASPKYLDVSWCSMYLMSFITFEFVTRSI